jgi:hypothetical protein
MFTTRSGVALIVTSLFHLRVLMSGYYLLAVAGYWVTSYFFLKNPLLLQDRRTKFKMPQTSSHLRKMIMAHRGGSWE